MKQHWVLIVVWTFLKRSLDIVLARLPVLPLELHLLRNWFCERDNLFFISINFIVLICKVSCYAIKNKSIFSRNNFLAFTTANTNPQRHDKKAAPTFRNLILLSLTKSSLKFFYRFTRRNQRHIKYISVPRKSNNQNLLERWKGTKSHLWGRRWGGKDEFLEF